MTVASGSRGLKIGLLLPQADGMRGPGNAIGRLIGDQFINLGDDPVVGAPPCRFFAGSEILPDPA